MSEVEANRDVVVAALLKSVKAAKAKGFQRLAMKCLTKIRRALQVFKPAVIGSKKFTNKMNKCILKRKFSASKYRKLRSKFCFCDVIRLKTIVEKPLQEDIESDKNDLCVNLSASDQVLGNLCKGLTLKQSFGLDPKPCHMLPVSSAHSAFNATVKRRKSAKKIDFSSRCADVIVDYIFSM